jgi:hypothetical protein
MPERVAADVQSDDPLASVADALDGHGIRLADCDVKKPAKTSVKAGQGDKGDQKRKTKS